MFKPVSPKLKVTLLEEEILRFWKSRRIFERSAAPRPGPETAVFYESPAAGEAFGENSPGLDQLLLEVYKDIAPRFQAMRGRQVLRLFGWQGHAPGIERAALRQLGFTRRGQAEAYGMARFNALCRQMALEKAADVQQLAERFAIAVDYRQAYLTCANEYIEPVWAALKQLWERGLVEQDYKVIPYCPACGVTLAEHELTGQAGQPASPAVMVRLPLVEDPGTSLLVWAAKPWTLLANAAVAVDPDLEYVIVERDFPDGGAEKLIVARARLEQTFGSELPGIRIFESFKGKKLQGLHYRPLFTFLPLDKAAHYVVLHRSAGAESGTGLAHLAPALGANDLAAALEHDLPIWLPVSEDGLLLPQVRPWRGKPLHEAGPLIVDDLQRRGLLYRAESEPQTHPVCPRCAGPVFEFARSAWFLRSGQFRERLAELNQTVAWQPEALKATFGARLQHSSDWPLGRERLWGTPLPVWECPDCHAQVCVGSLDELASLARRSLEGLDLHRPAVDEVRFACAQCGGTMQRVSEVLDPLFEEGALPAVLPGAGEAGSEAPRPAEAVFAAARQTGSWLYALHTTSAMLFDQPAFRRAACLDDPEGAAPAAPDTWEALNTYGADALRWYVFAAYRPGEPACFSAEALAEITGRFVPALWRAYAFFVAAANQEGWKPAQPPASGPLERWLLSELYSLVEDASRALDGGDTRAAAQALQTFVVERFSGFYLGCARPHFDSQAAPEVREAALAAVYETLVVLSRLLAPGLPFLAEEIYQNLVVFAQEGRAESVHLAGWPEGKAYKIEARLNQEMRLALRLAALGQAARHEAHLPLAQPLPEISFAGEGVKTLAPHLELLAGALNARQIRLLAQKLQPGDWLALVQDGPYQCALAAAAPPEPHGDGLAGAFVQHVQASRAWLSLEVGEQIRLQVWAPPKLAHILHRCEGYILSDLAALSLEVKDPSDVETGADSFELGDQTVAVLITKEV